MNPKSKMEICWRNTITVCLLLAAPFQWACGKNRTESRMDNASIQQTNIGALRRAYAAFNRNDIAATVEALDPQIEWTEPSEFGGGGTYHGHDGVKAYLTQSRADWAEGSSEPERFITAGDKIVVFVHARVRLKDSTEWWETRLADVFTFRDAKAVSMRAFADRQRALEWAGVKDADSK
jgi:ketosteroid isomerase-like protein